MNELILNVIKINEKLDYTLFIPLVLVYVLFFWLIVSIWVYSDSKLRYKDKKKAFLLAFLNLIFGLPFLLLYILARPFEIGDDLIDDKKTEDRGGVNVPIVNFVGKEGIVMSLELKINAKELASEDSSEMKIDVSFNPNDSNKVVVQEPVKEKIDISPVLIRKSNNAGIAGKLFGFLKRSKPDKISDVKDNTIIKISLDTQEESKNEDREVEKGINPNKIKKKKGKKKKH